MNPERTDYIPRLLKCPTIAPFSCLDPAESVRAPCFGRFSRRPCAWTCLTPPCIWNFPAIPIDSRPSSATVRGGLELCSMKSRKRRPCSMKCTALWSPGVGVLRFVVHLPANCVGYLPDLKLSTQEIREQAINVTIMSISLFWACLP